MLVDEKIQEGKGIEIYLELRGRGGEEIIAVKFEY